MPGNCRSSKGETLTVRLLLNDFVANMVRLVLGRAPRILLTTAKTHRCCSLALSRTRNRLRDAGHRGILKRYRRLVVAVRRIRRLASIVAAHYSILLGRSGSTSATWTRSSATCRSGNGLSVGVAELRCELLAAAADVPDCSLLPVSYTHLDVYKRQM